MGQICKQPLAGVTKVIKEKFDIKTFIETGTYVGDSAAWAATVFDNVKTIEFMEKYQKMAKERHGQHKNIEFLLGNSGTEMEKLMQDLDHPAFFWLDAHSGGGYFDKEDRCPLIDEIKAINQTNHEHFIFIDDARAFTSPPPKPFDWHAWPSIDEIIKELTAKQNYYVVITYDTIIAVPQKAKEMLVSFCHFLRPELKGVPVDIKEAHTLIAERKKKIEQLKTQQAASKKEASQEQ